MVDGTGCAAAVVLLSATLPNLSVLTDPEFDGHLVDFDNMIQRLSAYRPQEEKAHHQCHLDEAIRAKQTNNP